MLGFEVVNEGESLELPDSQAFYKYEGEISTTIYAFKVTRIVRVVRLIRIFRLYRDVNQEVDSQATKKLI